MKIKSISNTIVISATCFLCSLLLGDNVVGVLVPELILRCVSGVLVAFVHFGCEMNCCAELHVHKEKCVKSFECIFYSQNSYNISHQFRAFTFFIIITIRTFSNHCDC